MQPMTTIRGWQIDQLRKMITILQHTVQPISQEAAALYRDGGNGWTILEVMGHLEQFEGVFLERARLTATEEFPSLPFPDPETSAVENKYNEQNLRTVLSSWIEKRTATVAFMEGIADDQWERPGNHPSRGEFTLNDQLILTVWHDTNHLEQIIKIIQDKLTS